MCIILIRKKHIVLKENGKLKEIVVGMEDMAASRVVVVTGYSDFRRQCESMCLFNKHFRTTCSL